MAMTRDRVELFLASFLMLFVELVLIRWAGAYVVYLSYFANFILLGSFLGIGIGFLRARKKPDLFRLSPVALALFLGLVIGFPFLLVAFIGWAWPRGQDHQEQRRIEAEAAVEVAG